MSRDALGVRYVDRGGATPETAVIILGATDGMVGVHAEYEYIAMKHGPEGVTWRRVRQELGGLGVRPWDKIVYELRDGTTKEVYFDITGFFGR